MAQTCWIGLYFCTADEEILIIAPSIQGDLHWFEAVQARKYNKNMWIASSNVSTWSSGRGSQNRVKTWGSPRSSYLSLWLWVLKLNAGRCTNQVCNLALAKFFKRMHTWVEKCVSWLFARTNSSAANCNWYILDNQNQTAQNGTVNPALRRC